MNIDDIDVGLARYLSLPQPLRFVDLPRWDVGNDPPRAHLMKLMRKFYSDNVLKACPWLHGDIPGPDEFTGLVGHDPRRAQMLCYRRFWRYVFWLRVYSDGSFYWFLCADSGWFDSTREMISINLAEGDGPASAMSKRIGAAMRSCAKHG